MRSRKWTEQQLKEAALQATSVRQVLSKLGLIEAGGNYSQIKKYLHFYKVDTSHFSGKGWRRNATYPVVPEIQLDKLLVSNSNFQSFKVKNRLFKEGLKGRKCETCGWAQISIDGRLPLELHHINGDKKDNRIENLKVLCPNCHSLQLTHRGRNKKHS